MRFLACGVIAGAYLVLGAGRSEAAGAFFCSYDGTVVMRLAGVSESECEVVVYRLARKGGEYHRAGQHRLRVAAERIAGIFGLSDEGQIAVIERPAIVAGTPSQRLHIMGGASGRRHTIDLLGYLARRGIGIADENLKTARDGSGQRDSRGLVAHPWVVDPRSKTI